MHCKSIFPFSRFFLGRRERRVPKHPPPYFRPFPAGAAGPISTNIVGVGCRKGLQRRATSGGVQCVPCAGGHEGRRPAQRNNVRQRFGIRASRRSAGGRQLVALPCEANTAPGSFLLCGEPRKRYESETPQASNFNSNRIPGRRLWSVIFCHSVLPFVGRERPGQDARFKRRHAPIGAGSLLMSQSGGWPCDC